MRILAFWRIVERAFAHAKPEGELFGISEQLFCRMRLAKRKDRPSKDGLFRQQPEKDKV